MEVIHTHIHGIDPLSELGPSPVKVVVELSTVVGWSTLEIPRSHGETSLRATVSTLNALIIRLTAEVHAVIAADPTVVV